MLRLLTRRRKPGMSSTVPFRDTRLFGASSNNAYLLRFCNTLEEKLCPHVEVALLSMELLC